MFIHQGNLQKKSCYTFQHQELCLADKGFSCFLCLHIRGSTDFKEQLVVLSPISASNEFKFRVCMKLGKIWTEENYSLPCLLQAVKIKSFHFPESAICSWDFELLKAGWRRRLGVFYSSIEKLQNCRQGFRPLFQAF